MEGETVRLFMDVAFRAPEASVLYDCLCQLQRNALQVAGIQYRKESQRPPALQQLMAISWGHSSSIIRLITAISNAVRALLWALSRSS